MKSFILIGAIVAVLGCSALLVPSITFFTSERMADAGFFSFDVSRPHALDYESDCRKNRARGRDRTAGFGVQHFMR